MPRHSARPLSMAEVAKAAGVHQTTVSLALRNDPRLPQETRTRIQALADQLGYRPNPLVSALITLRRARRQPKFHATLAFVVRSGPRGPACIQHLAGARAAAEKQGYKIEEFPLGPGEMSERRVDAVLLARNIRGVLIAPLPEASGHFSLSWQRLCVVALEYTFSEPAFDRVVHDSYDGMRRAMSACRDEGCRRPGLLLSNVGNDRTERLNEAAYWVEQKSGDHFSAVPPLIMSAWDAKRFTAWRRRHRLEAVITSNDYLPSIEAVEKSSAASSRLKLINLNAAVKGPLRGVFQDPFNIGASAARWLIEKITHNEVGIPTKRQTTLTPGSWVEG